MVKALWSGVFMKFVHPISLVPLSGKSQSKKIIKMNSGFIMVMRITDILCKKRSGLILKKNFDDH